MAEDDRLTETVTLSEAKTLVGCLAAEQSVLLLSPPGLGKSDVVRQAAADAGLECRSLLGTQIAPEDVSGIPQIVGERSVFCPPRVLLPEDPKPFCLFLDELPACSPDIQKAFYSLLLERRLGEHPLPPGTWVVAAGNRAEDRSLVRTISSALINRVTILQIRVDVAEWLRWAEAHDVRPEIRTFIGQYPEALLRPIPTPSGPCSTPRAWASLSRAFDMLEANGALNPTTIRILAMGRLSEEDARRFSGQSEPLGASQALVLTALRMRETGLPLTQEHKITNIKALRNQTKTGLYEAKMAVEAAMRLSEEEIIQMLNEGVNEWEGD